MTTKHEKTTFIGVHVRRKDYLDWIKHQFKGESTLYGEIPLFAEVFVFTVMGFSKIGEPFKNANT